MFDRIIAYSIKQKFVIAFMVFCLIAVGIYSLKNLPIDALPDITNNQVQILTSSPNLATQEVELFITYPIELAVKSIPEIVELRSVSRFGLSIVTIVFEEDTDIYWARNQINERLNVAKEEIPEGFGTPELAPISTGLGEIYQYTISASKGFEDKIDAMDLRSVQDWIIIPQLLGTKGVAEVNTLGGILKEYEVAVNPNLLKSMDVTMSDIFDALSRNNENTGGAYIDKKPYAYFIRSIGMVNSLEDISKIVVKTQNGIPILVRDVAQVQFGNTVRYGAATKDGKGEVVNGMVMMTKGENSAEIVSLVKERMEQILKTLPDGIKIEPYLDRSKLVNRAISTVRKNLIEGALIVIFILVLLIGNWRAGLIVASVIPLALLFAVSMMKLFGVSGNLMSLGAIDFGLIVDGAVIIVEAIVHRLQTNKISKILNAAQMDEEVYQAASGIRSSAAFGEIIILIVYLPILALVGIEGKMFTPMAQTVAFAIFGAFVLSLTYVPMMSAFFLNKTISDKKNLSDKIIAGIQKIYSPVLKFALQFKIVILVLSVVLFCLALFVFNKLGGEFIPTLSEGDIATHIIIPPGSSLSQEIETTTKAEQMLLANFPEIEQIVSKIGSAEVPTDPMPMEVADMMIILKEKSEWTSASSKEEMFEKMESLLDDLPGVTTEFSQPIQMRFNELMTGVRSDVGIKIFGDDIERLVAFGDQVTEIVKHTEGVEDARAEAVSGFPQINVEYDKDKVALYGLNIADLNKAVSMGFAGMKAGVVYEEERKYDLVVRLAESYRQDISNINNLYINLPSGNQIPLEQIADITYERGPAQISREGGKRRIIVGFNVRGRDVETVVDEIQSKIEAQIDLPVGYYTQYAGQFENLKRAKSRLSIAVPIALCLIFVLLYFTFNSIKQSLMIFTAIPLSAIGGVFALWLRDMPFSISAGIGFIALFGVAVLNGIVLIAYFNQLKSEGMTNIVERIKIGTAVRLRPVIMTAAVASLGFLPMALSSSAGAEVQKPLATVVIGGLITATLLTLVILPILYYYVEKYFSKAAVPKGVGILILFLYGFQINAQESTNLNLDQVIELSIDNNADLRSKSLQITKFNYQKEGAYQIPNMEIEGAFGQINSRAIDQSFSIKQRFNPFLKKVKRALIDEQIAKSNHEFDFAKQELILHIKQDWNQIQYCLEALSLIENQQTYYDQILKYVDQRLQYGAATKAEKAIIELEFQQLLMQKDKIKSIHRSLIQDLNLIAGKDFFVQTEDFGMITLDSEIGTDQLDSHPLIQKFAQDIKLTQAKTNIYTASNKPEFMLGYFAQSINGGQEVNGEIRTYNSLPQFQGINVGISFPLFRNSRRNHAKALETETLIHQEDLTQVKLDLQKELNKLLTQYELEKSNVAYYQMKAIPKVDAILSDITIAYEKGEVTYFEYLNTLKTSYEIKSSYLKSIQTHNSIINNIQFLFSD